jgi:hypothetical protein
MDIVVSKLCELYGETWCETQIGDGHQDKKNVESKTDHEMTKSQTSSDFHGQFDHCMRRPRSIVFNVGEDIR